jgi:hypothetical protein
VSAGSYYWHPPPHPVRDQDAGSAVLDDGAVEGVGPPVGWDDVPGDQRLAGLVADADGEGRPQPVVGVDAPYGAPGLAHRRPATRRRAVRRLGLHQVHLHHVAVAILVLDQHREVDGVGELLHVETDLEARELARHPAPSVVEFVILIRTNKEKKERDLRPFFPTKPRITVNGGRNKTGVMQQARHVDTSPGLQKGCAH